MTDLAPLLQGFFTDKLMLQRQASPHTIAAYRDTFKLLLSFAHQHLGRQPARLGLADLDASMIGAFLQHLETVRGNSTTTRNARLAAIHSLFRYAAPRTPEHIALIQRVLAIPSKRFDRAIVNYLTTTETDALIASPNKATWTGRPCWVIRWWTRLRRWRWKDVRRHLTGPTRRWTRPSADGIELFNIASVPVTRYRYRGSKIPNPWTTHNHA